MPSAFSLLLIGLLTLCATSPVAAQTVAAKARPADNAAQLRLLLDGAKKQVGVTTAYDPAYRKLAYPGGDVPLATGVCADVIIRAFRNAGIDLQQQLHEDMTSHFTAYPQKWGLKQPDPNIDHRRVLNLMTWFRRQGKVLPVTVLPADYLPGDVVAWDLGHGLTHIGIVADIRAAGSKPPFLVIHNIGGGARQEDILFAYAIIGHYRYF